jgi:hypothetical protein
MIRSIQEGLSAPGFTSTTKPSVRNTLKWVRQFPSEPPGRNINRQLPSLEHHKTRVKCYQQRPGASVKRAVRCGSRCRRFSSITTP